MGNTVPENFRDIESLFQQAPMFMAVLRGPEHVFELANESYYQLIGHREIVGKALLDALPEIRGQGFEKLLTGVLETGVPFVGREVAVNLSRTPGSTPEKRYVDFVYAPMESGGVRSGVMAHGVDVTDHVMARLEIERLLSESETAQEELSRANEQLQEQAVELELTNQLLHDNAEEVTVREEQIRTLADAIPTLAWTAREDGYIDWYNARWYEYTGTSPGQMAGWGWQSVHHPDTLQSVLEKWRAAIDSGTVFEMTFPLRGSDGTFRRFLTRVTPLKDWSGRVTRWFGTNTDVEMERQAREAAEGANKAKTEFLANMSHELRTPLNAIAGYADILDLGIQGPLNEAQQESINRIRRSQRHLLGLINEVLNYAKLETGTVQFDAVKVRLGDAIGEAESLVSPQARTRGITLMVSDVDSPVTALADAEKLMQILVNLLSNAVKFTDTGGKIEIRSEAIGAQAVIHVTDTGIGIPADKLDSIFDPFVQVRADLARLNEGTGLGLAISRDLARGMNGDLTVESSPGSGSTFTLVLPIG